MIRIIVIMVLAASVARSQNLSDIKVEAFMREWDEGMGVAYSTVKIRESSPSAVFEKFVFNLECTRKLKTLEPNGPQDLRTIYEVAKVFSWKNFESGYFFPFVYCQFLGIDPSLLLYYTDANELALMDLIGALYFKQKPPDPKKIKELKYNHSFRLNSQKPLGFQPK